MLRLGSRRPNCLCPLCGLPINFNDDPMGFTFFGSVRCGSMGDDKGDTLSVVIRRDVRIVFILRVLPTVGTYGGSL